MNTLFKISAAFATALVTLAACQKVNEIEETPALTHTVKFTSSALTKTSYAIEGTTVKYKWEESDLERIHVFEDGTEGTVVIEDSAIDEDYILLTVNFGGSGEGSHTYTANLNNGTVGSNQVAANDKYDSDCDVLVAKPVSSEEITDGIYTFQFRRPVAITELKLKGLKAGEEVSKVTILSDASSTLTGTYTQGTEDPTTGEWGNASNKIVVTFGAGETKTVESDGSLIVPIVSTPVEDASIKVLVETESGLKYRKKTSAALTLTENNVKVQGIVMNPVTEAEHANAGWYLVTNASELFDGDEIRIACTSENKMAGDFLVNEKGTQVYLEDCTVSFNEGKLTGVTPGKLPLTFTLSEGYLFWNILSPDGDILCAKDKDGMKYNDGVADWSISINEVGESTISSTTTAYGSIQYNKNNPRFRNYISSQTGIQIYKKYGNPVDPAIKTARIASFNPESATVTIDANNNVFPELSFDPTEATEGTRTWTSSNTDVATVDAATGEVTLVSAGTTTISVEIAESDDYQPCEASYELTVKPAPIEGLDIIDNDFVGKPSPYTSWNGKVATTGSGNTYAGQSTTQSGKNNIQMRATSPSGIVVTASGSGKVARKVSIAWADGTASGRSIKIYGKNEAYDSTNGASDLYSDETKGTELGSITYNTSTELTITGDYEYIGILPVGGALYVENISILWEDAKPEYELNFWDDMAEETITGTVNGTAGDILSFIKLRDGETTVTADAYESSNTDVAEVEDDGDVILKKKGDAVITATLNGDDTHKTTKISYTIHVSNVLSSINLTDDSEQPTTFYVGQDFSFEGIKIEAEYNDGEKKTLTADDLTTDNFSGFDSSAVVESQTITISYTDNGTTKTTTYNVEIKPAVTLYGISVPAEDEYGNSITVKGGLKEAAEGDEIELDVNLATGYKLTSLKINNVEHSSDVEGGKYVFNMPAAAVEISATFEKEAVTVNQFSWSVSSSTETYTTGYTLASNLKTAGSGYRQDNSAEQEYYITLYHTTTPIFTSNPGTIKLTIKIGGGTGNKSLSSPVYYCLVNESGTPIENTEIEITSKITNATGDEYSDVTLNVPNEITTAYGVKIYHYKTVSYNCRFFYFNVK